MKSTVYESLSDEVRAFWHEFTDEHDQHPGYVATDRGAYCDSDDLHADSEGRVTWTAPEDGTPPEPTGPTTIPISFELDLSRYLGEWSAPHGVGPEGEGVDYHRVTLEEVLVDLIEWTIHHAVAGEMTKQVTAAVAEAKDQVLATVTGVAADEITKAVKAALR